ncbi:MAG: DUF6125 family protein, partial [Dehalococcoidia bacterium]|nr:DUF6125 family protein [Dehalococcoidia bacterium]
MAEKSTRPKRTAVDVYLESQPTEMLVRMVDTYGRLYQKLDGFWYLSVMNRWGNDMALDRDVWVWTRASRYEVELLSEALGLSSRKDLEAFVQVFAASPITMVSEYLMENSPEGVVITITYCPILAALEKEGKGREQTICQIVDPMIFGFYARYFGGDINIEALKLPPRSGDDRVCCQWRLRRKDGHPVSASLQPLRPGKMSPEALVRLIKAYCRLYQVVDAYWYLSIRERWGNEAAMESDFWVWERLPKSEVEAVSKLLGIEGKDDLDSMVRLFLTVPMNMTTDYTVEQHGPDRAIVTFTFCPVLRALEKEGQGREEDICRNLDIMIFNNYTRFFNPRIKVRPVLLPPRPSPS